MSSSTPATLEACECSICYDVIDLKTTGEVKLSCSHSFHFSCIASWFSTQEKGSCPCCRKEMGDKEDFAANAAAGEDDEDDEDEEDEDEDEDDSVSLNKTELMAFLRRNGLANPHISYEEWGALEYVHDNESEYQNEARIIFTYHEFECFLASHSQKILGLDLGLWDDLLDLQETPMTEAFMSANLDFGMPLRLPSAPPPVKVSWKLMEDGSWTRTVFNPEEEPVAAILSPALTAAGAAATAAEAATKVQAVWRGFSTRVRQVMPRLRVSSVWM
jgi:hypothetical protein